MCGFLTRLCRCKQRVEKPVLLFIKETNIIIKSLQKLLKIRKTIFTYQFVMSFLFYCFTFVLPFIGLQTRFPCSNYLNDSAD